MNGEKIAPYDPLFLTYNPKADDSELAKLGESKEYPLNHDGIKSKMRITFSYLPESWWDDEEKMYKPGSNPENKIQRKLVREHVPEFSGRMTLYISVAGLESKEHTICHKHILYPP